MADYVILPAAKTEYDNAFDWYFAEDPRRAGRFETAVERAIATITDTPEWWPPHDDRHRLYLVKKFPYLIYYRFEGGFVTIVAIAHERQRLDYWQGR